MTCAIAAMLAVLALAGPAQRLPPNIVIPPVYRIPSPHVSLFADLPAPVQPSSPERRISASDRVAVAEPGLPPGGALTRIVRRRARHRGRRATRARPAIRCCSSRTNSNTSWNSSTAWTCRSMATRAATGVRLVRRFRPLRNGARDRGRPAGRGRGDSGDAARAGRDALATAGAGLALCLVSGGAARRTMTRRRF